MQPLLIKKEKKKKKKEESVGAGITTLNYSEYLEYEIEIPIRCYPGKKKLHNVGKNNPKQVSAERKRTRMDSTRAGKDPEVTEEQSRFHV